MNSMLTKIPGRYLLPCTRVTRNQACLTFKNRKPLLNQITANQTWTVNKSLTDEMLNLF